tara:strand:- start:52 stop:474 length:423 start_codon:yes stop_codon:yes gene_type:complete
MIISDYYLAIKILQYIDDPLTWRKIIPLSKTWNKAIHSLLYSLICQECNKSGKRVWRRINHIVFRNQLLNNFNSSQPKINSLSEIFNFYCDDCLPCETIYDDVPFQPAIPLKPGDTKEFWLTSDIPQEWIDLWKDLPFIE